jgi:Tfp pilus assembly protein PilO
MTEKTPLISTPTASQNSAVTSASATTQPSTIVKDSDQSFIKSLNQLQPLYRFLRQQAENKKFLKYLEIGATFSLIAVFLFFAILPTASAISGLVGQINSKEIYIKNMKTKINSILQAQQTYAQAQEKYSVLESSFPSTQKFYESATNFSGASKQSSISLSQLKFDLSNSTSSNLAAGKSFNVSIFGNGQYAAALDFIKKITNSRRLISIDSIQISQPNDQNSDTKSTPGTVNLNMSSDLFFSPISK